MSLVSVRFKKSWSKYFDGDVAGFEPHDAKKLVDIGVADPLVSTPPAAPSAPPGGGSETPKSEAETKALDLAETKAHEAIELIAKVDDAAVLAALLQVDDRKTVREAAELRIEELNAPPGGGSETPAGE